MLTLTVKLLICSSFMFIYLDNKTTLAQADFFYSSCGGASNNTENSMYQRNLDTTLSTLPTTNSGFGFFNFSSGEGNDKVNSVALCRGDVNPDVCRSCLNDSIIKLRNVCPNRKEAIVYHDYCLLKYSNHTILGQLTGFKDYMFLKKKEKSSDVDRFNEALRTLLLELRIKAADGGPLRKFATGNTAGPGVSTIYALVQCTPDLSEMQCNSCLEDTINRISDFFNGTVGGRVLLSMCNFRYETITGSKFFNDSTDIPQTSLQLNPPIPPAATTGTDKNFPHKGTTGTNKRRVALITAVTIGVVMVLVVIILCFVKKLKQTHGANNVNVDNFLKNHEFLAPKKYSYSQVKKMTSSLKVKLGQGGFGSVYRGELSNGNLVAVKVLNELKGNGEDFINEVASVGRTCHVNIVTLVGFCCDGNQRALIYEFMPNGSLERFIYGRESSRNSQLGWEKLHQIAIGIARGLEYLHSGCNTRILHFDIKPHNILLNKDFLPKISDFGLAKLYLEERSMISMSHMRGTPGYIAPELYSRSFGQVSHKSDVYSYGMMILEMVGGRKNIEVEVNHTSEIYFPHWIYKKIEVDKEQLGLHGIVTNEENEMVRKMIVVGLWCIQTNPLNRPAITKVLEMLEGDLASLEIPPKPYLSSPPRSIDPPSTDTPNLNCSFTDIATL